VVGDALSSSSQPSTVVVEQQVTQQQPAWMTSQQVPGAPAYGTRITTIPAGSREKTVMGTTAYENNGVWYRPVLGESGVYYQVVSPPPPEGDGSGNSQGQ
jgi:hypothetical protein